MKTFVLLLLATAALAHDWEIGYGISCPTIQSVKEFSVNDFLGTWYVIEQTDTDSVCLTFTYEKVSATSLKVTKTRQNAFLDSAGFNHTNQYAGNLDLPSENSGTMRVKWPLNPLRKGDYYVIDTDYLNYAGIYDCQEAGTLMYTAYRQSAAILSRTPTLDQTYIDRIKRLLQAANIDTSHMDKIDHTNCRSEEDTKYKISMDGDTVKDSVRNFFSDAADTVSTYAQSVADGVNSFVNNLRRMGSPFSSDAETVSKLEKKDIIRK